MSRMRILYARMDGSAAGRLAMVSSFLLAHGAPDRLQIGNRQLLVLTRHHDPRRAGRERLDHALVDRFGIVGSAARQVEPDAGVDLRLPVRACDAACGFARDVLR